MDQALASSRQTECLGHDRKKVHTDPTLLVRSWPGQDRQTFCGVIRSGPGHDRQTTNTGSTVSVRSAAGHGRQNVCTGPEVWVRTRPEHRSEDVGQV